MKKLIALEPEMYENLKAGKCVDKPKERFTTDKKLEAHIAGDLDKQMQQILNAELPQHQKIILYNQTLQQLLNFKKKIPETHLKPNEKTLTADTIFKKIAPRKRPRAMKVLDRIKANKSVEWDSDSRFVLDNVAVLGINIVDLVDEASSVVSKKRKANTQIPGWTEFQIWRST